VSATHTADGVDSGPVFLPISEDLARSLRVGVHFEWTPQLRMSLSEITRREQTPR
jgi:hypothetical protein